MSAASGAERHDSQAVGSKVPPPLVFLASLGLGIIADQLLPSISLGGAARWAAAVPLAVAGLALSVVFLVAFRRAGTPVDLRKPVATLVTSGPYRFSRNPGYLSLTLLSVAIAIAVDAPYGIFAAVVAAGIIDRLVIPREERYLFGQFGAEYRAYTERTRRWL